MVAVLLLVVSDMELGHQCSHFEYLFYFHDLSLCTRSLLFTQAAIIIAQCYLFPAARKEYSCVNNQHFLQL